MADLEHSSSVGGYPIIHEGNVNYTTRNLNYTENMISRTFADGKFNRVFDDRDSANPKNGDILIERGPIISIYYNEWREVFFSAEQPPLVTSSSFMFRTDDEALLFQNANVPIDAQLILETWPRVDVSTYYASPDDAQGESADWLYDPQQDSFVQPNNSVGNQTLLSPIKTDSYKFEATLTSPGRDDDLIGLVISADNSGNDAYQVIAWVNAGGLGLYSFYITYSSPTTSGVGIRLAGNAVVPMFKNPLEGWDGKHIRMSIQRDGSNVSAKLSGWNDVENLIDDTELVIDLSTISSAEIPLDVPTRYGFATRSQANSTYTDIQFRSADYSDDTNVYSIEGNKHWEYNNENWVLVGNATDDLEGVDIIINPYTKERYVIENGEIIFEANEGINYNTPNFDFTGQSGNIALPTSSILVNFTYTESIDIKSVFNGSNSDVLLSPNDEIILRLNGSGYFYVLISTEETVNPQGGIEKTIAYRKVTYIN